VAAMQADSAACIVYSWCVCCVVCTGARLLVVPAQAHDGRPRLAAWRGGCASPPVRVLTQQGTELHQAPPPACDSRLPDASWTSTERHVPFNTHVHMGVTNDDVTQCN
jgi:hypothetical protein